MKRILFLIVILFLVSGISLGYELGAGSGTSYPAAIDTDESVEVDYPDPLATTARAAVPNDTNAAVIAIETELGINPSGAYDTLRARLDAGDGLYYPKTEIDSQAEVEAIWGVSLVNDGDLDLYYLKTEIDSLSEVEAIYFKDIIDSDELAALKFTDLADTPAAYDNGKYAKSTADGVVWDTPAGGGASTYLELTDTPINYDGGSLKFVRVNEGETALEFAAEADPMVDTDAEIKAILVDEVTKTGAFTSGKIAKINNATGIIEEGTNTDTDVADAVTKKHSQNTDTALGIQTQNLNMGTHKIIGVVDPVNPQEAATKAYADTKVATEVDPTVDSDAEIKAILVNEVTKTGTFTAGKTLKINSSTGVIEEGDNFDTQVTDAVVKKHTQNTDTSLDMFNELSSDHSHSGLLDCQIVGEAVDFGDLLYFYWTTKKWKKADADTATTMPGLRIALESKIDGQPCKMLVKGYIRDDSAFEFAGAMIYASTTPGAMSSTAPTEAGDQLQRVGVAISSADMLFFDPSIDVGEIKP